MFFSVQLIVLFLYLSAGVSVVTYNSFIRNKVLDYVHQSVTENSNLYVHIIKT